MSFVRLSLLATAAVGLVATHASADPLPMRPKVTARISSLAPRTCGQPFNLQLVVESANAKLDGQIEFRGVSSPVTLAKDSTSVFVASGGTYDCAKDLGGTVAIQMAGGPKSVPLWSTTFTAKKVKFSPSNKTKVAAYDGFVSFSVPETECGQGIKAQVINKLQGKAGIAGPAWKMIVTGNGVSPSATYPQGSTDVQLGTLDCSKGAPTFTLAGPDVTPISFTPETVSF